MKYLVNYDEMLRNILYFSSYKTEVFFFLPKQFQISRSILQDGSRTLGMFKKGKTLIIAKCHRADLPTFCSHSTEGKTLFYSQINTTISWPSMPEILQFWQVNIILFLENEEEQVY